MIRMIWAEDRNGMIGSSSHPGLLWQVPEDLSHFKFMTADQVVVMGRRTWESLPAGSRPLSGRTNLVLTRQLDWSAVGATAYASTAQLMVDHQSFWVIGGREIYQEFLPYAQMVSRTVIDSDTIGDLSAPVLDETWELVPAHKRNPRQWRTSVMGARFKVERFQKV